MVLVAQWIARWISNPKVPGSNPGWDVSFAHVSFANDPSCHPAIQRKFFQHIARLIESQEAVLPMPVAPVAQSVSARYL